MTDEKSPYDQSLLSEVRRNYQLMVRPMDAYTLVQATAIVWIRPELETVLMRLQKIDDPAKIDYSVLDEGGTLSSQDVKKSIDEATHNARIELLRHSYRTLEKARFGVRDEEKLPLLEAVTKMHHLLGVKDFKLSILDRSGQTSDADMRGKITSAIGIAESRLNTDLLTRDRWSQMGDGGATR